MRCPKCGHEVGQDEAFCGQCGTPVTSAAHATEMVYTPPPPLSGQLKLPSVPTAPNGYNNGRPAAPSPTGYNPNMLPPYPPPQGAGLDPNASAIRPAGQQPTEFYQDATEAFSVFPANNGQGLPSGYNSQKFPAPPPQAAYPASTQDGTPMSPFQVGSYTQHGHPQAPQFPGGQSYAGYGVQPSPQFTPPPQKRKANTALIIASLLLGIALIGAIAFGSLYLLRGHNSSQAALTPTPAPTLAPTQTPTPSPTPSPTATPIPSPTATSPPAPDANFSWCTTACTSRGFIVEYPNGWNQGQTSDQVGVTFLNPAQQDQYGAFKVPVTQTGANASQLVDNDLQSMFANQPGYTPPDSKSVTTIGGETWTYGVAYYQSNNQKERVEVFATVHLGKNYVIELQAADNVFDTVNSQYFSTMIGRFQFQQA